MFQPRGNVCSGSEQKRGLRYRRVKNWLRMKTDLVFKRLVLQLGLEKEIGASQKVLYTPNQGIFISP